MKGHSPGFPWAVPFGCPSAGIGLVRSQHLHLGDTSTGELRGPPGILHATPRTVPRLWSSGDVCTVPRCPPCALVWVPLLARPHVAPAGQDPSPAPCWVGSGTRRLSPGCPLIRLLLDLFMFPKMFCTEIFFFLKTHPWTKPQCQRAALIKEFAENTPPAK